MSTARTIIKNRVKAGNTVIGVGCYSAAITSASRDKVLKVGNTTTDPWLQFYYKVVRTNPNNPHLPKVHSIHVDDDHDYYVAVVEKLYEHEDRAYGDICGLDALEELVANTCNDDSVGLEDWMDAVQDVDLCFGEFDEHQLYAACNQIRHMIRTSYVDDDCECEYYEEDCDHTGYESLNLDLHSNNILYREDGTLVINDPVSDSDMDDVDDLSIWADEEELVD